jgi:hypothetical protein
MVIMRDNLNLQALINAAGEVIECQRVLANTQDNLVSDILRFSDNFVEWDHYPKDDVKDSSSGAQYYYHAHPNSKRGFTEHGHFHSFMKNKKNDNSEVLPLTHIIAISMDNHGIPQALFTVNHWVTGGVWEDADIVSTFLDDFLIDHAKPSWVVNRWITAMLKLYKTEIIKLVKERDLSIKKYQKEFPKGDVLEMRELEITSYLPISIEAKLLELQEMEEKNFL